MTKEKKNKQKKKEASEHYVEFPAWKHNPEIIIKRGQLFKLSFC